MIVQQQETLLVPKLYTHLSRFVRSFHSVLLKSSLAGVSASELNKVEKQMTALLLKIHDERGRRGGDQDGAAPAMRN
jgi:hypothetical protein